MRRTILTGLASVAVALSAAGAGRTARAGITYAYTLKDLGTLPFPAAIASEGFGVNDAGQVAGTSYSGYGLNNRAFLSGPGGGPVGDLGTPAGPTARALPSTPPARSPATHLLRAALDMRSYRVPTAAR